jgi:hypothetical protein
MRYSSLAQAQEATDFRVYLPAVRQGCSNLGVTITDIPS